MKHQLTQMAAVPVYSLQSLQDEIVRIVNA